MNDDLPITIYVADEVSALLPAIDSTANKLAAQLNFQTLTASWYGDEENVLSINLFIELPPGLSAHNGKTYEVEPKQFADDVVCYIDDERQIIDCYIAITDKEVNLLESDSRLLKAYLPKKLNKVINLIAEQQGLVAI